MQITVDIWIHGATVLGCAAALKAVQEGKSVLLTESTIIPGGEFAAALHGAGTAAGTPRTPQGEAFVRLLSETCAAGGTLPVHLPAVQPLLAKLLLGSGVTLLLNTSLAALTVQDRAEGRIYCQGSFYDVSARTFLDTTTFHESAPFLGGTVPQTRRIAAVLCSARDDAPLPLLPGMQAVRSRFPRCAFVHTACEGDFAQVCIDIARQIEQTQSEWTLALLAHSPDGQPAAAREGCWAPSAYWPEPVAAYDAGVEVL